MISCSSGKRVMPRKWTNNTSSGRKPSQEASLGLIAFSSSVLPLPGGPATEQWLPAQSISLIRRISSSRPSGSRLSA